MPLFSTPKVPPITPPPPAATPATTASSNVVAAGAGSKARSAAAGLAGGTNLTGGQGLTEPPQTSGKTLLGQ